MIHVKVSFNWRVWSVI